MFRNFNLYDLYVLSFVQLLLSTLLVLSPARTIGLRLRRTGSRVVEVLLGGLAVAAMLVLACFLAAELWGLPAADLETGAYLITIFAVVVMMPRRDYNVVSQLFYVSFVAAACTFLAFASYIVFAGRDSNFTALTSSWLILIDVAAFVVWTSHINYASDVLTRTRHSRRPAEVDRTYQPMVSLHIPAHNEPPDMLIETIRAAEAMDYPDFEIIVIDNNTTDPAIYGPVAQYCQDRERVRFVHVENWSGYKAGACNLALRSYTDPRAEVIGLIDADDIVKPYYLAETVPHFSDPRLGFVQTFEGNRDYEGSPYYTACVDSYQGFYLAMMSSRNERDSVPFVGTMGLLRRSALEGIGGWNEWCISEDTEASLRVLKAGWSGLYIPRCFGRGLVPPTFAALNTQRHRWCFGAMQILRLHWRSLMPWDRSPDNHLTSAQRRDYLMGSLGWFRDLLMFGFSLLLLVTAGLLLTGSRPPLVTLSGNRSLLPLSLILIATICTMWNLRDWTTMSRRRALYGLVISLSATWATARACIEGLTRREGVFLRTSKSGAGRHPVRTALRICRAETVLALALYCAAGLLAAFKNTSVLLIFILSTQGTVYFCAAIASFWNLRQQRIPRYEHQRRFEQQRLRQASRARRPVVTARRVVVASLALLIGIVTAAVAAPGELLPGRVAGHVGSATPRSAARGGSTAPSVRELRDAEH